MQLLQRHPWKIRKLQYSPNKGLPVVFIAGSRSGLPTSLRRTKDRKRERPGCSLKPKPFPTKKQSFCLPHRVACRTHRHAVESLNARAAEGATSSPGNLGSNATSTVGLPQSSEHLSNRKGNTAQAVAKKPLPRFLKKVVRKTSLDPWRTWHRPQCRPRGRKRRDKRTH